MLLFTAGPRVQPCGRRGRVLFYHVPRGLQPRWEAGLPLPQVRPSPGSTPPMHLLASSVQQPDASLPQGPLGAHAVRGNYGSHVFVRWSRGTSLLFCLNSFAEIKIRLRRKWGLFMQMRKSLEICRLPSSPSSFHTQRQRRDAAEGGGRTGVGTVSQKRHVLVEGAGNQPGILPRRGPLAGVSACLSALYLAVLMQASAACFTWPHGPDEKHGSRSMV